MSAARSPLDRTGARSAEGIAAEMRRRAEVLAVPAAAEREPSMDVLVFVRGEETYALEVSAAAAVIPLRQVVALPGAGDVHLGLMVHRGQVHALIDIGALLDRAADRSSAPAFAIVLDSPDCAVALAADVIRGTRMERERDVRPAGRRPSIVRCILPDGASVLSIDAVTRNARIVVDDRPQLVSPV